jgi:hypothetical protein
MLLDPYKEGDVVFPAILLLQARHIATLLHRYGRDPGKRMACLVKIISQIADHNLGVTSEAQIGSTASLPLDLA